MLLCIFTNYIKNLFYIKTMIILQYRPIYINNKYINVVKAAVINKPMPLFFKNSLQNL